jgi:DNA helicase-2/ATP-dependent DNA helicase PcrA
VNGPLLVLAGAGSGKTTVLVNRIYHIINFGNIRSGAALDETGVQAVLEAMKKAENGSREELVSCLKRMAVRPALPGSVLCITFTNKAAGEFKERLTKMLGDAAGAIWAGTFHSICVRILRRNIGFIGFSNNFTIYDADDSKKLIVQIMKDLKVDDKVLPAKAITSAVSSFKEDRVLPEEAEVNARDPRARQISEVYTEYQKRLKAASALDFDDIILNTLKLFEEHPEVLDYYRRKFEYILVDEYQDTNPSQNDLVVMLGRGKRNV